MLHSLPATSCEIIAKQQDHLQGRRSPQAHTKLAPGAVVAAPVQCHAVACLQTSAAVPNWLSLSHHSSTGSVAASMLPPGCSCNLGFATCLAADIPMCRASRDGHGWLWGRHACLPRTLPAAAAPVTPAGAPATTGIGAAAAGRRRHP